MHPLAIALVIGAFGGIVAALCGVGGGVVMVPAFVLVLKMGQKTAVATSLAAIVLTAICTTFKNHANGFIVWRVAIPCGIAGGAIGWFAADWLKKLQDITLTRIFATLIIIFGIQMWLQSLKRDDAAKPAAPGISTSEKRN